MKVEEWKVKDSAEFDGDILITDPCYIGISGEYEDKVSEWGGLMSTTYYGDWGCTVYAVDAGSEVGVVSDGDEDADVGRFCADAGLVCVVPLEKVREENPEFENWLKEHYWCGCIIRGFKGVVKFVTQTTHDTLEIRGEKHPYTSVELHVRGDGEVDGKPVAFESLQTSL